MSRWQSAPIVTDPQPKRPAWRDAPPAESPAATPAGFTQQPSAFDPPTPSGPSPHGVTAYEEVQQQLRAGGMTQSAIEFHKRQGPPEIPVEQQPDFIDDKAEWMRRFGHRFANTTTDAEFVFRATGGRNLDRQVPGDQQAARMAELEGTAESRNALERFVRSFTSSVIPYAATQQSGELRYLRERERDPGAASFAGDVTGSIVQFVPSFFSPVIFGATVADHAREAADATYAETGDPVAAIGTGVVRGVADMAGFHVAGHVFGRAASRHVGEAIMQGNTRAAARAIGDIAAGSGSVAAIESIALIVDEMQQAANVDARSYEEAWDRITEQLPDRLLGGAFGGALLTGFGAAAAGIRSVQYRRAVRQRIDAASEVLRTGTIPGEGTARRRVAPEQQAAIREGLNRYARDMEARGYPDIAARARDAAKGVKPTAQPQRPAEPPQRQATQDTSMAVRRQQQQPQQGESLRAQWYDRPFREIKAKAAELGINPQQSKPALVDALVAADAAPAVETPKVIERTEMRDQPSPAELEGGKRRIGTFAEKLRIARALDKGIRAQAVKLVKENLPVVERGKVITQIRDARTLATLRDAIQRAVKVLGDYQHRHASRELERTLKRANKARLRPEFAKHIEQVAGDIDVAGMSDRTRALLQGTAKFLEDNPDAPVPPYVIRQVARLDKKSLEDMEAAEIEVVTDAVKLAVHLSKTKNRLVGKRRKQTRKNITSRMLTEMAERVPELPPRVERKTGLEQTPKRSLLREFLLEGGTRPEIIMEHLSPALRELVWEDITVQAHHVEQRLVWQFRDALVAAMENASGLSLRTTEFEQWRLEPLELTTPDGPIQITRDEAIWMLTTIKDPSNRALMDRNGATLERSDRTFTVTEAVIENLHAITGEAEASVADFMHKQFNGPLKKALNDAWVEVFGYEVARVPSYVPRKIDMDRADTGKDPLSELNQDRHATMTSWGNLRDRVGSNAPLEIGSALDTFLNHSEHVARISAYLAPTSNAYAMLGQREVKQAIIQRLGKRGYNRILSSISMQTVRVADKTDAERTKRNRLRMFGAGVLGFRLGPLLLNPTGLPVSASYIDGGFGHLAKSLQSGFSRAEWRRISAIASKHSPYWRTRYESFVEQATSGMISDTHRSYGRPDIAEIGLVPLQKSDQFGATIRWRMAERYIDATRADLDKGTDAYYAEVAREWERLMFRGENTAHGGDMTGLLAFGRQHIWFAPMVMFTSSVSKIYSVAVKANLHYHRAHQYRQAGNDKAAAREIRDGTKALAGFIAAGLLAAVVRQILSKIRGRDEDGTISQRLALRLATEIAGYIPIIGEAAIAPMVRALTGQPVRIFSASVTDETIQRIGQLSIDLTTGVLDAVTLKTDADGDLVAIGKLLRAGEGAIELAATLRGAPYSGTKDILQSAYRHLLADATPDLRAELRKLQSDADLTTERRQLWRAIRLNDPKDFRRAVDAMQAKGETPTERAIMQLVTSRYGYLSRYEDGAGELTPELRELVNQHLAERDAMLEAAALLIYQNTDAIELTRHRTRGRPKP